MYFYDLKPMPQDYDFGTDGENAAQECIFNLNYLNDLNFRRGELFSESQIKAIKSKFRILKNKRTQNSEKSAKVFSDTCREIVNWLSSAEGFCCYFIKACKEHGAYCCSAKWHILLLTIMGVEQNIEKKQFQNIPNIINSLSDTYRESFRILKTPVYAKYFTIGGHKLSNIEEKNHTAQMEWCKELDDSIRSACSLSQKRVAILQECDAQNKTHEIANPIKWLKAEIQMLNKNSEDAEITNNTEFESILDEMRNNKIQIGGLISEKKQEIKYHEETNLRDLDAPDILDIMKNWRNAVETMQLASQTMEDCDECRTCLDEELDLRTKRTAQILSLQQHLEKYQKEIDKRLFNYPGEGIYDTLRDAYRKNSLPFACNAESFVKLLCHIDALIFYAQRHRNPFLFSFRPFAFEMAELESFYDIEINEDECKNINLEWNKIRKNMIKYLGLVFGEDDVNYNCDNYEESRAYDYFDKTTRITKTDNGVITISSSLLKELFCTCLETGQEVATAGFKRVIEILYSQISPNESELEKISEDFRINEFVDEEPPRGVLPVSIGSHPIRSRYEFPAGTLAKILSNGPMQTMPPEQKQPEEKQEPVSEEHAEEKPPRTKKCLRAGTYYRGGSKRAEEKIEVDNITDENGNITATTIRPHGGVIKGEGRSYTITAGRCIPIVEALLNKFEDGYEPVYWKKWSETFSGEQSGLFRETFVEKVGPGKIRIIDFTKPLPEPQKKK